MLRKKAITVRAAHVPPSLLLVEDDVELGEILQLVLQDEGYLVRLAASLEAGLAFIETQTFDFILTDLLSSHRETLFDAVDTLRRVAYPTPVGIITAWQISAAEVAQRGFACLISKPFELDALLTSIAVALNRMLTPERERQARVVRQFLESLSARRWEEVGRYCTEDITFYPPAGTSFSRLEPISGLDAYLAYAQESSALLPEPRFEEIVLYSRPDGLAARYTHSWRLADGQRQALAGSALFKFAGERIRQIGVSLNAALLQSLLARTRTSDQNLSASKGGS